MIQFYILFLLYVVIVQPITIVIGFILRFMYHLPPEKKDINIPESLLLQDMCENRLRTLSLERLRTNGDCAKFLGMYYWATGNENIWKDIVALCDIKSKCFHRTPKVTNADAETKFSGDMLSGFMGALAHRITTNKLTSVEKVILTTIWDYSSFSGWPMLLNHATKGKTFERGFIWAPWRLWDTMDLVRLLTWLYLGYKISHKKSYLITYYIVYILTLPALLLSTYF